METAALLNHVTGILEPIGSLTSLPVQVVGVLLALGGPVLTLQAAR